MKTVLLSKSLLAVLTCGCLLYGCFSARALFAEEHGSSSEAVFFEGGLLNINAMEIRPEDLLKEIGEKCGIKVVVIGEVFSELPVSVKIEKLPLRKGISALLKKSTNKQLN